MSEATVAGKPSAPRRMTRKRRRLIVLVACMVCLGSAAALMLSAFSDTMVFFLTPSDIATKAAPGRYVRLGGLVEDHTLKHVEIDGRPGATFRVTDGTASVDVSYVGILPDLFREGQGVVAMGKMTPDGHFAASEVLAKHDENYMPKDVAEALKKSGRWNPGDGPPPPAETWDALRLREQAAAGKGKG